ncbi:MAG TPA: MFS transporter [Steroidobacter sp.]|uniref:spinster family MFS transporter n=1 Tax=Steroidobacter sp. TaxID=1978227 RepID=UPI002ED9F698
MNTEQSAANPPLYSAALPYPASAQAWYMVFVLLLFYIFSFIDRQIISLLVEPIKRDLQVTDTQIGLLQGFAFALFYTFFGIPIGRLADRMNRKSIVAAGVIAWSLMATCCGLAKNWLQLLLARAGVGVGEAALSPAAYSMISDAFPREKQGRAFSVYNMGIAIGAGVAMLVGGLVVAAISVEGKTFTLPLLGEVRAWQFVFIVTGAPGLLLPLLLLGVREPARRGFMKMQSASGEDFGQKVPFREVMKFLLEHGNFYSLHFIALAMLAMVGYAVGGWLPTVIARTYGVAPAQVGVVIGLSTIFINTTGIFLAGKLCDWWASRGHTDAPIKVALVVALATLATSSLTPFMPSFAIAVVAICIAGLPFHGYVAMGPMAVNQVTPNQMRAQISSVYLFTVNLIGMGVGPALVPFISDYILQDPMQIRWALLIVVVMGTSIAATLLWLERPLFREKIAATASWH